MLDVVANILTGLVANALWAAGSAIGRADAAAGGAHAPTLEAFTAESLRVDSLKATALDKLAGSLGPHTRSDLDQILEGTETATLVHELLTARLLDAPASTIEMSLKSLETHLDQQLDEDPPEGALGRQLAETIDGLCQDLVIAVDELELPVRSSIKQLAGLSSLSATVRSIDQHLHAIEQRTGEERASWRAFEQEYRAQVRNRHGTIILPDFEIERRIPISELYVEPTIEYGGSEGNAPLASMSESPSDLLRDGRRLVLLGDPGSGKSTLAAVLTHGLAADSEAVPFLVILREYGPDYQAGKSFVEHIERVLNTRYQIAPPRLFVEDALTSGRGVAIFDGLDELLDPTKRREIRSAVDAFATHFPQARVLVTSRKVGYEQAPLPESTFAVCKLANFSPAAVERYATNWFTHSLSQLSSHEIAARRESFMSESEAVGELRSNPLMLSLMCVLYRGSNYIPESRLGVYEECAKLLFVKWDRSRDIAVTLEIGPDIENALMELAHWMLLDDKSAVGVTEAELVSRCADYLQGRRYEERADAERVAFEFVCFCRGRGWVLDEVGSTAAGESLYTFTHRTFLEYYAAFEVARRQGNPESMATELAPYLAVGQWDMVAQLALQMANRHHDAGADRMIAELIDLASTENADRRGEIARFVANTLQYTIPRPETVRRICSLAIRVAIDDRPARGGIAFRSAEHTALQLALGALPATRATVAERLRAELASVLDSDTSGERAALAFYVLTMPETIAQPPRSRFGDSYLFWRKWANDADSAVAWRSDLASYSFAMAAGVERGAIAIGDFARRHPIVELFDARGGSLARELGAYRPELLALISGWLTGDFYDWVLESNTIDRILLELSEYVKESALPLCTAPSPHAVIRHWMDRAEEMRTLDRLERVAPTSLSGAALLLCMNLEVVADERTRRRPWRRRWPEGTHRVIRLAYGLAEARRRNFPNSEASPPNLSSPDRALASLLAVLDTDVQRILLDWAARKVSFWEPEHRSEGAEPAGYQD